MGGSTARIGAALAVLALTGCGLGGSRLNPVNWFGSERETRIVAARADPAPPLVEEVVALDVARSRGAAIVSAVGRPPTQGFWEADLVRVPSDDPATLLLEFRILPPLTRARVGTPPSREVLAGTVFSDQDLAGIRTIAVRGRANARSLAR